MYVTSFEKHCDCMVYLSFTVAIYSFLCFITVKRNTINYLVYCHSWKDEPIILQKDNHLQGVFCIRVCPINGAYVKNCDRYIPLQVWKEYVISYQMHIKQATYLLN